LEFEGCGDGGVRRRFISSRYESTVEKLCRAEKEEVTLWIEIDV
jgi:hypothetical protein